MKFIDIITISEGNLHENTFHLIQFTACYHVKSARYDSHKTMFKKSFFLGHFYVVTGSIARSANLPVFSLLRGRF